MFLNIKELLNAYNKHERISITLPGFEKVATHCVVKFISKEHNDSFISYFKLNEEEVDSAIESEINYFSRLNKSFEWKTYDFDTPANIGEKLIQHGFVAEESESFMVLDLDSIKSNFTESEICVEVSDAQGIKDAISVQEEVWGSELSVKSSYLLDLKKANPENLRVYIIYIEGKPVSSAWIVYNDNSPFAGIWGGSTIAEYRGKGYYSALLRKRINDAKQRGLKYLIIDASDMSKPIVEKHGFQFVAKTTPYIFQNS